MGKKRGSVARKPSKREARDESALLMVNMLLSTYGGPRIMSLLWSAIDDFAKRHPNNEQAALAAKYAAKTSYALAIASGQESAGKKR